MTKTAIYQTGLGVLDFGIQDSLIKVHHFHKEIEIIYVIRGKCTAVCSQDKYELNQGDLFIAFPNQIHYYPESEIGGYFWISISPIQLLDLEPIFKTMKPTSNLLHIDAESNITQYINNLRYLSEPFYNTKALCFINLILAEILPKLSLEPTPEQSQPTVKSILSYCQEHYNEDITLHTLAQALHLNEYHISHIINKELKINLRSFINSLRIGAARNLLQNTNKRITEISEEVGYDSIRSFNRIFYSIVQQTPKEYRESFQSNL